jgi:hypothetical protein
MAWQEHREQDGLTPRHHKENSPAGGLGTDLAPGLMFLKRKNAFLKNVFIQKYRPLCQEHMIIG